MIPVTVLLTLVGMRLFHMSFNLMTLGGIAAAIGLVIDDAIVVVEAIHAKMLAGHSPPRRGPPGDPRNRPAAGRQHDDARWSSSFRWRFWTACRVSSSGPWPLTMVFALLTSLVLAVTLTPALAAC